MSRWAFEVWNEPNLEVFWSGTPEEYFRLYDVSARAVKSVDPDLRVGGPSSAAAGWIGELLGHLEGSDLPLDFLSTHVYGNVPLDLRPVLASFGRAGRADLVDRVGHHADPLPPRRGHGLRRGVPAPRHGLGARADRGAVALGGLGPLRGAGRAAGAVPRRVRAAVGGEPAQAPVLGHGPAGPARAVPAAGIGVRRRSRRAWWRRWPRGTTTGGSASWPGTSPWTRARSAGTRCWTAGSGSGCPSRPGRRTGPALPDRRRALQHRPGLGADARRRPVAVAGAVGGAGRAEHAR